MAAGRAGDIDAMRKGLTQCLHQIRAVPASLAPAQLDDLSFAEAIRTAICLHELRTRLRSSRSGAKRAQCLKGCAYEFVRHRLSKALQQNARRSEAHVRAVSEEIVEIELHWETERSNEATGSQLMSNIKRWRRIVADRRKPAGTR